MPECESRRSTVQITAAETMDVGRKIKMENTAAKHHMSTAQMTVTALMTAITCILAPMALPIPVSPVPISLTNLVIFFMAYILGTKLSVASYVLYLLLGTVGLPVFSGFSGGVGKLLGPTGGYLIGFIFLAAIVGFFVEKFPTKIYMHVIGMILGYGSLLRVWYGMACRPAWNELCRRTRSRRDPVSSGRYRKDHHRDHRRTADPQGSIQIHVGIS